jgi:PPIC-type PPIASE domain
VIERIRRRFRPSRPTDRFAPQRRISRREREEQQRRILYIAMASIAVLVVGLLVGGAIFTFVIQPRQVLASVNGVKITRSDYWKLRRFSLGTQIAQYQFFSSQNPQQYASIIQQLQQQLRTVKTDAPDSDTLQGMVDDIITQQNLGDLGLSISADDLNNYIADNFAPGLVNTPTATTTVNPTVIAWATETASAAFATATAQANATPRAGTPGTPGAAGTPGTPVATPATPVATPGTPGTPGTPEGTPSVSPTATISRDQALATATAGYASYLKDIKDAVDMSRDDYIRLVARPQIARQKVTAKLTGDIKDVQPQVHAVHILLATKEGAEQARQQILQDPGNFAQIALQQSTDTSTNQTGGDLGWFPRGVMVKEFEDVAFVLPLNQVSEPVQTRFGWHLIKVIDKSDDRPLASETLSSLKDGAFQKWLDRVKVGVKVDTTYIKTTPTPASEPFSPPPGAPPAPTPTAEPIQTPFVITPSPGAVVPTPFPSPTPTKQP